MQSVSTAAPSPRSVTTAGCHPPSSPAPSHISADAPHPQSHSSPQCCHCGWRGAHAPTCPFK
ncbi:hypothetical protein BKA93DRAFT_733954 [Sparassis latifolia]|uniref:Uncharacterized protein n=1 Tax=Sparassis crispa TaxID=139825 RepID=A0A401G536_9APHY|nr:hypothetical protein SCP_0101440 [Sparassis crispa]GBE77271.1 hypothetical protein SCP_0101440 [Sparassis crispa]